MTHREVLIALVAAAAVLPACAGDVNRAPERRFKLQGKVVAVKTNTAHHLRIEHAEIPGFMQAMTMDYRVKPEENLTTIQLGDEVRADVVAPGDGTATLENVTVTKKAETVPRPEVPPAAK